MDTKTRNKPLEVGDLVRIRPGVHDEWLPAHRTGLLVEVVAPDNNRIWIKGTVVLYRIQFGNKILRFHPMWVEKVS